MLLKNSVSGFLDKTSPEEEMISFNTNNFKVFCHGVSQICNASDIYFNETHVSKNFSEAILTIEGKKVHILFNEYYPYVAFASSVEFGKITFIDNSELTHIIRNMYRTSQILNADELNEPLLFDERTNSVKNKNSLNKNELKQIGYWKPKTVGEVLFNFWD